MKIIRVTCTSCRKIIERSMQIDKVSISRSKSLSEHRQKIEEEIDSLQATLNDVENNYFWTIMHAPNISANLIENKTEYWCKEYRLNEEEQQYLRVFFERDCLNSIIHLRNNKRAKTNTFKIKTWVKGYWKNYRSLSNAWKHISKARSRVKIISMDSSNYDDDRYKSYTNQIEHEAVCNKPNAIDSLISDKEHILMTLWNDLENAFPYWEYVIDEGTVECIADHIYEQNNDKTSYQSYLHVLFTGIYEKIETNLCAICKRSINQIFMNQYGKHKPRKEMMLHYTSSNVFEKRKIFINL